MKSIFSLLLVCVLCGCQAPSSGHVGRLEDTSRIGSEEVANLPRNLRYAELVKLWGAGYAADPFYFYQSKIDGIMLAVIVKLEPSDPVKGEPEDGEVTDMYFTDMLNFWIHAWGDDSLHKSRKLQKAE